MLGYHCAEQPPEPWISSERFAAVAEAARIAGLDRLKPIFDHLNGTVPYEEIRICVGCLRNQTATAEPAMEQS